MAPLLHWVMSICAIPLEEHVLLFVLPGSSLALLRSFTEHRQARVPAHRTAIVEDQGLLALLFLNNNFHVVHHQYPNTAWYLLPAIYHQQRADISHQNNGFVFAGYGAVLRKFSFRRHDDIIHKSDINRSI